MTFRPKSLVPYGPRTFQVVGDIHANATDYGFRGTSRLTSLVNDTNEACPAPVARWQVGDYTDTGVPADDAVALATHVFTPDRGGRTTFHAIVVGNHDVSAGSAPALRTAADAMAAYAMPGVRYLRDYAYGDGTGLRLIALGWDDFTGSGMSYDSPAQAFLAASLDSAPAGFDCVLLIHPPLKGTVLATSPLELDSNSGGFCALPLGALEPILGAHTKAKLVLSGHTHSSIDDIDVVKAAHTVGSRTIATVNTGAPAYTGGSGAYSVTNAADPVFSLWVDHWPGEGFEVRWRNHGTRTWGWGPVGNPVAAIPMPA